jgi:hypothetical protein
VRGTIAIDATPEAIATESAGMDVGARFDLRSGVPRS